MESWRCIIVLIFVIIATLLLLVLRSFQTDCHPNYHWRLLTVHLNSILIYVHSIALWHVMKHFIIFICFQLEAHTLCQWNIRPFTTVLYITRFLHPRFSPKSFPIFKVNKNSLLQQVAISLQNPNGHEPRHKTAAWARHMADSNKEYSSRSHFFMLPILFTLCPFPACSSSVWWWLPLLEILLLLLLWWAMV